MAMMLSQPEATSRVPLGREPHALIRVLHELLPLLE